MAKEVEFTLNGERYIVSETYDGWGFEHYVRRQGIAVWGGEIGFESPSDAQQAAMEYHREWEAKQREAEASGLADEEEAFAEKKYGTYEQQVRSHYNSTRL